MGGELVLLSSKLEMGERESTTGSGCHWSKCRSEINILTGAGVNMATPLQAAHCQLSSLRVGRRREAVTVSGPGQHTTQHLHHHTQQQPLQQLQQLRHSAHCSHIHLQLRANMNHSTSLSAYSYCLTLLSLSCAELSKLKLTIRSVSTFHPKHSQKMLERVHNYHADTHTASVYSVGLDRLPFIL